MDAPEFQAFKRHDRYGTMGVAPQSVLEYLRLALLAITVLPLKCIGVAVCVVSFYIVCK